MSASLKTGALRWKTQLDTHPAAVITASAAVTGDMAFTPTKGDLIAMGHKDPLGGRIENDVVPPVRRTQRDRLRHLVLGCGYRQTARHMTGCHRQNRHPES